MLALLALAACGDPLAKIPTIEDVDVAGPAPVVDVVAAPVESDPQAGFFQRLMSKRSVAQPAANSAVADGPKVPDVATAPPEGAEIAAEAKPATDGFFSFLRKKPVTDTADAKAQPDTPTATVQKASLTPEPASPRDILPEKRGGLFGGQNAGRARGGITLRDVVPGEVLPYGEIARACHVKQADLGTQISKYPNKRAKYRIYDSAPGAVTARTFYITGFGDGCARQTTAALAMFGTAGMYESLRYGLAKQANTPKKMTDKAYEKVKSQICHTGRAKPCGKKLPTLEKDTVFLSFYDRFEDAQRWTNILVSDGALLAVDND
jgi:hypothetical protein